MARVWSASAVSILRFVSATEVRAFHCTSQGGVGKRLICSTVVAKQDPLGTGASSASPPANVWSCIHVFSQVPASFFARPPGSRMRARVVVGIAPASCVGGLCRACSNMARVLSLALVFQMAIVEQLQTCILSTAHRPPIGPREPCQPCSLPFLAKIARATVGRATSGVRRATIPR